MYCISLREKFLYLILLVVTISLPCQVLHVKANIQRSVSGQSQLVLNGRLAVRLRSATSAACCLSSDFQHRRRLQALMGVDEIVEDVVRMLEERRQLNNTFSKPLRKVATRGVS